MKLQILHLQPHDDQVSARDKLRAVKADRALLVWPRHGRILQRRLDLALLRREAEAKGLQLGLLTHDPQVRDHARHEHIPVFDHLDRLPEERWLRASATPKFKPPGPEAVGDADASDRPRAPEKPGRVAEIHPWVRWTALALAALALVSLVGVLVPSATVVIAPPTQEQTSLLQLPLQGGAAALTPSGEALPAELARVTLSASDRVPATGRRSVPAAAAQGSLLFTNLTQEAIELPAGTSVRASSHPAIHYQTTEPVSLPAEQGAQILVAAAASELGEQGNVDADLLDAVDGPLGLDVTVTNPAPFTGGADARQPSVRQADLESLRQSVLAKLQQQAEDRLAAELPAGRRLASASIAIDRILTEIYDAAAGELATSVGLEIEAEVTGYTYRQAALEDAAARVAERRIGSGWELVPGTVQVSHIRSHRRADGTILVQATAQWRRAQHVDRTAIANRVAGLTPADARAQIQRMSDGELLAVELRPSWLPRMPWVAARIAVVASWERR